MKQVTITVSGAAGTGKSLIAQLIYEALQARRIPMTTAPADVVNTPRNPFELGTAAGSLMAQGWGVALVEQHTPKAKP